MSDPSPDEEAPIAPESQEDQELANAYLRSLGVQEQKAPEASDADKRQANLYLKSLDMEARYDVPAEAPGFFDKAHTAIQGAAEGIRIPVTPVDETGVPTVAPVRRVSAEDNRAVGEQMREQAPSVDPTTGLDRDAMGFPVVPIEATDSSPRYPGDAPSAAPVVTTEDDDLSDADLMRLHTQSMIDDKQMKEMEAMVPPTPDEIADAQARAELQKVAGIDPMSMEGFFSRHPDLNRIAPPGKEQKFYEEVATLPDSVHAMAAKARKFGMSKEQIGDFIMLAVEQRRRDRRKMAAAIQSGEDVPLSVLMDSGMLRQWEKFGFSLPVVDDGILDKRIKQIHDRIHRLHMTKHRERAPLREDEIQEEIRQLKEKKELGINVDDQLAEAEERLKRESLAVTRKDPQDYMDNYTAFDAVKNAIRDNVVTDPNDKPKEGAIVDDDLVELAELFRAKMREAEARYVRFLNKQTNPFHDVPGMDGLWRGVVIPFSRAVLKATDVLSMSLLDSEAAMRDLQIPGGSNALESFDANEGAAGKALRQLLTGGGEAAAMVYSFGAAGKLAMKTLGPIVRVSPRAGAFVAKMAQQPMSFGYYDLAHGMGENIRAGRFPLENADRYFAKGAETGVKFLGLQYLNKVLLAGAEPSRVKAAVESIFTGAEFVTLEHPESWKDPAQALGMLAFFGAHGAQHGRPAFEPNTKARRLVEEAMIPLTEGKAKPAAKKAEAPERPKPTLEKLSDDVRQSLADRKIREGVELGEKLAPEHGKRGDLGGAVQRRLKLNEAETLKVQEELARRGHLDDAGKESHRRQVMEEFYGEVGQGVPRGGRAAEQYKEALARWDKLPDGAGRQKVGSALAHLKSVWDRMSPGEKNRSMVEREGNTLPHEFPATGLDTILRKVGETPGLPEKAEVAPTPEARPEPAREQGVRNSRKPIEPTKAEREKFGEDVVPEAEAPEEVKAPTPEAPADKVEVPGTPPVVSKKGLLAEDPRRAPERQSGNPERGAIDPTVIPYAAVVAATEVAHSPRLAVRALGKIREGLLEGAGRLGAGRAAERGKAFVKGLVPEAAMSAVRSRMEDGRALKLYHQEVEAKNNREAVTETMNRSDIHWLNRKYRNPRTGKRERLSEESKRMVTDMAEGKLTTQEAIDNGLPAELARTMQTTLDRIQADSDFLARHPHGIKADLEGRRYTRADYRNVETLQQALLSGNGGNSLLRPEQHVKFDHDTVLFKRGGKKDRLKAFKEDFSSPEEARLYAEAIYSEMSRIVARQDTIAAAKKASPSDWENVVKQEWGEDWKVEASPELRKALGLKPGDKVPRLSDAQLVYKTTKAGRIMEPEIVLARTRIMQQALISRLQSLSHIDRAYGLKGEKGQPPENMPRHYHKDPLPSSHWYGPLAGKYVPKSIYGEMVSRFGPSGGFSQGVLDFWSGIESSLKGLNTMYNPTTHGNNIMGNIWMASMTGFHPTLARNWKFFHMGHKMLRAKAGDEFWNTRLLVEEMGVNKNTSRSFDIDGITNLIEKSSGNNFIQKRRSLIENLKKGRLAEALTPEAVKRITRDLYEYEDLIFKAAAIMHQVHTNPKLKDLPYDQAVRGATEHALRYYPNYATNPVVRYFSKKKPIRQIARLTVIEPFLGFWAESARIAGIHAKERPEALALQLGLLYALTEAAQQQHGISDDDLKALQRVSPDWAMPGSMFQALSPLSGDDGRLSLMGMKFANPWADHALFARDMLGIRDTDGLRTLEDRRPGGEYMGLFGSVLPIHLNSMLGEPLQDIFIANKDRMSGRTLVEEEGKDPADVRAEKLQLYLERLIPPMAPGGRTFKKIDSAVTGRPVNSLGDTVSPRDAALQLLGVRNRNIYPRRGKTFKIIELGKKLQATDGVLGKAIREGDKRGEARARARIDRLLEDMRKIDVPLPESIRRYIPESAQGDFEKKEGSGR